MVSGEIYLVLYCSICLNIVRSDESEEGHYRFGNVWIFYFVVQIKVSHERYR